MSIENANNIANITSMVNNLQRELDTINGKINEIIINNKSLKKKIWELTAENNDLFDLLDDMENQTNNLNQYTRRENIEISNISEKIVQRQLEAYVLEVFESIGINLQSYDLVAVHRLGKFVQGKNRNVIVRFINRKNAYTCLRNSKKLAESNTQDYKKLFFIENLCPSNKRLFNYLYKLKKENKINKVSFNGSVYFKISNSVDDYGQKVEHIDDINHFRNPEDSK